MKPFGCQDMTAMEVAEAVQLYLDGGGARQIAAEYKRHPVTVRRLVRELGLYRGPRHVYRGPRAYLVQRMLASYPPELHP